MAQHLHARACIQCARVHPNCREETVLIPITNLVNNVPITTYIPQTDYYPRFVGWQAARDDLTKVAPLYETHDPNEGIRSGGLRIRLSGPQ